MDGALVLWLLSRRKPAVNYASQAEMGLVGCNMKTGWLDAGGQVHNDRYLSANSRYALYLKAWRKQKYFF